MAKPTEVIQIKKRTLSCDGGNGPLGHPRVFLTVGSDKEVLCPYCSRLYQYQDPPLENVAD